MQLQTCHCEILFIGNQPLSGVPTSAGSDSTIKSSNYTLWFSFVKIFLVLAFILGLDQSWKFCTGDLNANSYCSNAGDNMNYWCPVGGRDYVNGINPQYIQSSFYISSGTSTEDLTVCDAMEFIISYSGGSGSVNLQ